MRRISRDSTWPGPISTNVSTPLRDHLAHRADPLDRRDHLRGKLAADVLGAGAHLAGMLVTIGTCGSRSGERSMMLGQPRGGLLHQRRVRGDADPQRHDRARAGSRISSTARSSAGSSPEITNCSGVLVLATLTICPVSCEACCAGDVRARRDRARPPRPCRPAMLALLLHQPAALAHQAQRVAEVERAGRHQRRVLAQAVAGDEARRLPVVADAPRSFRASRPGRPSRRSGWPAGR